MRKTVVAAIISLACAMSMSGCATYFSPEQLAHADYGPRPPKNYQALIKESFAHDLIDPTSPLYEFGAPSKGYFEESALFNTQQMFGWKVCGRVNSKNRMGGYVGSVPFVALFKDGSVAQHIIGESSELHDGLSLINIDIKTICERQ